MENARFFDYNDIANALWYFARSGLIHLSTELMMYLNFAGLAWSKTVDESSDDAYYFNLSDLNTYSSYHHARWVGFSVHCVDNILSLYGILLGVEE